MAEHHLKTDPAVFEAVKSGEKSFEIRFNDRNYRVGDVLVLRETYWSAALMKMGHALQYTGRTLTRRVSHILSGYGLQEGWVCLSFASTVAAEQSSQATGTGTTTSPSAMTDPADPVYIIRLPNGDICGSRTAPSAETAVARFARDYPRYKRMRLTAELKGGGVPAPAGAERAFIDKHFGTHESYDYEDVCQIVRAALASRGSGVTGAPAQGKVDTAVEAEVQAVLQSRARSNASGQDGEDIEQIRSAVIARRGDVAMPADVAAPAAPARSKRPTAAQLAVLRNLAAGRTASFHLRGRSAMGGLTRTLSSMRQLAWIEGSMYEPSLTHAGRAALGGRA